MLFYVMDSLVCRKGREIHVSIVKILLLLMLAY